MHDGSIDVESETGKGSSFTVRLPVKGALELKTASKNIPNAEVSGEVVEIRKMMVSKIEGIGA